MRRQKDPRNNTPHNFYCTQCGQRGIPICRTETNLRKPGHLKKLYCIHCKTETNHVECAGAYSDDMFLLEFRAGNFAPDGTRILPFSKVLKGGKGL